jgi:hypothetical protein
MNFTQYNQLQSYYSEKILKIAKELNKKATVWQGFIVYYFEFIT